MKICTDLHRLARRTQPYMVLSFDVILKIIVVSKMIIIVFVRIKRIVQTCTDLHKLAKTCMALKNT